MVLPVWLVMKGRKPRWFFRAYRIQVGPTHARVTK